MFVVLTVAGPGKKQVLVNLMEVSCVHAEGRKSVLCFGGHDPAQGMRVDEDMECIAVALGSLVVRAHPG